MYPGKPIGNLGGTRVAEVVMEEAYVRVVAEVRKSRVSKLDQGWRGGRHHCVSWRICKEFDSKG